MRRIQVQDLHYSFGARMVLRGLNLEMDSGQIAVVRGKNGAGKSTFLRLLAGILRPMQGTIRFDGLPAREQRKPSRMGIGVCIQENFLYGDLSLEENFRLSESTMNAADSGRCRELISKFELEPFLTLPARKSSQGVGQKASLVKAFLRSPGVILLDEPFAHLDKDSRETLSQLIVQESGRGAAIICVLHDPLSLDIECVSHWVLSDGKLNPS